MKKRAFWIVSFVSALTAIIFQLAAFANATNRDQRLDSSMKFDVPEKQRQVFLDEAHHFNHTVNNLVCAGIAVATLSAICLFVSKRNNEPVKYSIVIILWAFYLLLQFAAV